LDDRRTDTFSFQSGIKSIISDVTNPLHFDNTFTQPIIHPTPIPTLRQVAVPGSPFKESTTRIDKVIRRIDDIERILAERKNEPPSTEASEISRHSSRSDNELKAYIDSKFDALEIKLLKKVEEKYNDFRLQKLREDADEITNSTSSNGFSYFKPEEHLWLKITELELKLQQFEEDRERIYMSSPRNQTDNPTHELDTKITDRIEMLKRELEIIDSQVIQLTVNYEDVKNNAIKAVNDKIFIDKTSKFHQRIDEMIDSKVKAIRNENKELFDPPDITIIVEDDLKGEIRKLRKAMINKLDSGVLEELMRHIATRDELKQLAEVTQSSRLPTEFEKRIKFLENTQKQYLKLVNELKKASTVMIKANLATLVQDTERKIEKMKETFEERIDSMKEYLEYIPTRESTTTGTGGVSKKVSKDLDQKLQVVYSELSACKQAWEQSIRQPFYRCAQWIWKSGHLKFGSSIPWNIETSNTGKYHLYF
jgi:hypothetical protein